MNELQTIADGDERMTSLQIAEVTGRPHNDVMKAIRKMEPAWAKVSQGNFSLSYYEQVQPNGGIKKQPCYSLKELEEAHQKASVPTTYLEALKSLVKSEEQRQQLALENRKQQQEIITISRENAELGNKITEMLPKVSYYDQILQSNATMTVTQIAQDYGLSAQAMNKLLAELKIQYKSSRGQWILYGELKAGGYVHSRPVDITKSDGTHDVKYNTEWTTKGRIFLYEALKKKCIVPLIEKKPEPQPEAKRQIPQLSIRFTNG